jgi:hypothetical protein
VRSLLRTWRVWWLALAVMAAPQLSYVHALSHLTPRAQAGASLDDRQQAPDKVCDTCLSLAHLGDALASQPTWTVEVVAAAAPALSVASGIIRAQASPFQARAPPALLLI